MGEATVFKFNLGELGHSAVRRFQDTNAWKAGLAEDSQAFFRVPCILESAAALDFIRKDFASDDRSHKAMLSRTLARWSGQFPRNSECIKEGRINAPLLEPMGLEAMVDVFQDLVPDKSRLQSTAPAFQACAGIVMLVGQLAQRVGFGLERFGMATLRAQISGHTKFIMVSAQAVDGLHSCQDSAQPAQPAAATRNGDSFKHFVRDLAFAKAVK